MRHLDKIAAKELSKIFRGRIVLPDDPSYNEARTIFNAMVDKRPAIIAQCSDADDVVRAVLFSRKLDLEIAVRGGGHGVAGKALTDGGIVIDLRRMNSVSVNTEARTVAVAGGATMRDLDSATTPHGLATTGGRVSSTGVGGYALGGGDGWLARKMGLACDNLLSVELVTAKGEIIQTNEKEHSELFWALHGGGGNFGIATSFTFRLHELPTVTVALLLFRPEQAEQVLIAYRDYMMAAPDEVGGGALFVTGPKESFTPEHLVNKLTLLLLVVFAGPKAEAQDITSPLLLLGHEGAFIAEMPNADFQCMLDDPPGNRNYWSAEYLNSLPDEAISLFSAQANDLIIPSSSQHVLIPQGGAVGRSAADFPIPWRHAPWCIHPFGLWKNPTDDERMRQWVHAVRDDLRPWSSGATYLNFIGDEGEDRIVRGLGQANYSRLAKVKATYDPENTFHLNHNIKPAAS